MQGVTASYLLPLPKDRPRFWATRGVIVAEPARKHLHPVGLLRRQDLPIRTALSIAPFSFEKVNGMLRSPYVWAILPLVKQ